MRLTTLNIIVDTLAGGRLVIPNAQEYNGPFKREAKMPARLGMLGSYPSKFALPVAHKQPSDLTECWQGAKRTIALGAES